MRSFARVGRPVPAALLLGLLLSPASGLEAQRGSAPRSVRGAPPARAGVREARLVAVRREVLADTLRITLELEREVSFVHQQLDGPPRVFFDLEHTRAGEALAEAVIPFPDDLVRQVRLGRQPDGRTRVVLDLAEKSRYSVYALYDPFRLTIDFQRPSGTPTGTIVNAAAVPSAALASALPPDVAPISASLNVVTTGSGVAPDRSPAAVRAEPPPARSAATATPPVKAGGGVSLSRQLGLGVARIAVDPGHGGHDPGAKGRALTEADLVLDVALRLERLLQAQPGVEVVLTRRRDVYVPLEERTAIANREGADLFLSIHANASGDDTTQGVETYFLDFTANAEAEALAARENAGSARSMRELPEIVKAIALHNKLAESRDFAGRVQASLHERLWKTNRGIRNLGVKQAPFMVLIGASMPSVLAEVSFITNRQDTGLLRSDKYRQEIAGGLLSGILRYQQSLKKSPVVASR